jgi:outer membrane protein assembly factor BamD (BamD/ComL family)
MNAGAISLRGWAVAALLVALCGPVCAQKKTKDNRSGYDRSARATVVHPAIVYVAADGDSQHVAEVTPGHEVVVTQRAGPWVKVFANTDFGDDSDEEGKPEFSDTEDVQPTSGWIRDKGVVSPATVGGDAILFGAAANFEDAAEQPHAPKDAAEAAHLLYRRVAEYYPASPLAAEALWRSADVRWQIDKREVSSLPSAKEQEAYLRQPIYEGEMKKVMKLYPESKFAALAAFDLIDNKLCGDWQGLPKCPEMEAVLYERYAQRYPASPKAAEALYDAAYRQGVLVSMWTVEANRKRAADSAAHCQSLTEELAKDYAGTDYATRAANVAYRVRQGIAVYGNDRE